MIELCKIPGVRPGLRFEVQALRIDGESPSMERMREWSKSSTEEYRRIIAGLERLCDLEKSEAVRLTRVSPDRKGRGIYELCNRGGGNGRVFFFYPRGLNTIIVLTNAFWKGARNQEGAFDEAARLKALFESQYESK